MNDADKDSSQGWERGWSEHKIRQLVRLARMSFAEKLDWLEEAHRLAEAIRCSTHAVPRDARTMPPADGHR